MLNVTQVKSHGLKSKNVVLSNALIRSAQGLNLVEKRILMAAITRKNTRIGAIPFKAPTKRTPNKASSFATSGTYRAVKIPIIKPMIICWIRLTLLIDFTNRFIVHSNT